MSVAVLTPNWLGDVVMSAPALKALKRALEEADPPERLAVYAPSPLAPLVRAAFPADEVIAFSLRKGIARLGDRVTLARRMRSGGQRMIVLFPNSFPSALAACLARIPERVGTPMHARGALITRKVEPQRECEHLGDAYVRIVEAAVGRKVERRDDDVQLTVPAEARGRAAWILGRCGLDPSAERFVAIAPGAAYGPAKQWGEGNFAALARLVAGKGLTSVVVGTGADSVAAREIARQAGARDGGAGGGARARVVDVTGRTDLVELAGVLSLASAFVGNDSGAAHLAAALGTPAVVVYLSTDPGRTAQRGRRVEIIAAEVDCRPCMRRVCARGDYACRAAVEADEVVRALDCSGPSREW